MVVKRVNAQDEHVRLSRSKRKFYSVIERVPILVQRYILLLKKTL